MLVRDKLPCPACGSKDAGAIYRNKDEKGEPFLLFSCFSSAHESGSYHKRVESVETYFEDKVSMVMEEVKLPIAEGLFADGEYIDLINGEDPWGFRAISKETCKLFNVSVRDDLPLSSDQKRIAMWQSKGLPTRGRGIIFPNYNEDGDLIGQKIRTADPETGERIFTWYKKKDYDVEVNKTFFGSQVWRSDKYNRKKMVVVFGEFDALAVHEMFRDYPVVSVPDGDNSAKKYFERYYAWLRKFDELVFVPDNDGKCIKIVEAMAAKFPRQSRIVNLSKHKDPCDYLVNKDYQLFREEFFAAPKFTPQKIVGLSSFKKELLEDPPVPIADYPWEGLNQMTGGIWPGELITIKAPPKVGKSSTLSEIAYHLHQTTNYKIGMIYLEETKRDLVFRLVGAHLSKNLQRPEIRDEVSTETTLKAFSELTQPERFMIVEHWGACSSDFIEEKITELVVATGCEIILFDHISMAITDESNKDERLALDRLVAAIKALTVGIEDIDENGNAIARQPTIFMITHVNDDGKPRGSRAAIQMSNLVLGLQRDKLSEDPMVRNTLTVVVEENRRYGESGVACRLLYDYRTSRLTELKIEETENRKEEQKGYVYSKQ